MPFIVSTLIKGHRDYMNAIAADLESTSVSLLDSLLLLIYAKEN